MLYRSAHISNENIHFAFDRYCCYFKWSRKKPKVEDEQSKVIEFLIWQLSSLQISVQSEKFYIKTRTHRIHVIPYRLICLYIHNYTIIQTLSPRHICQHIGIVKKQGSTTFQEIDGFGCEFELFFILAVESGKYIFICEWNLKYFVCRLCQLVSKPKSKKTKKKTKLVESLAFHFECRILTFFLEFFRMYAISLIERMWLKWKWCIDLVNVNFRRWIFWFFIFHDEYIYIFYFFLFLSSNVPCERACLWPCHRLLHIIYTTCKNVYIQLILILVHVFYVRVVSPLSLI